MINSTVEIVYNRSYQCGFCLKKVDEKTRENRKNCTGKNQRLKKVIGHYTFSTCPGNFYHPSYGQLLDVHRLFRKGVLANPGGLLDQPSKYIDLMNLIESLVSEKEIEIMKKSAKDGRKSS